MTEDQSQASEETGRRTGVPAVDAVLDEVDAAAELSVDEQVAVFERAHEQLRRALDGAPDAPADEPS